MPKNESEKTSLPENYETATAIILSTGSEIVEGLYPDTNAQEISQRLKELGIKTILHHAIPDDADLFRQIVKSTFGKTDLVICTGGIGPTEDDLNRELTAELYEQKLVRIPEALQMIKDLFARRGRELPSGNLKQADIPEHSTPLLNHWGTACGFFIPKTENKPAFVSLPGVPKEWRAMFDAYFDDIKNETFKKLPVYKTNTIHVVLVPESELNKAVKPFFSKWEDVEIGLLAKLGRVRIRITVTSKDEASADERLSEVTEEILPHLPQESIFSVGEVDITLEEKVIELFRKEGMKFSTAESCTGGGVAKRITDIAGSSDVFDRGFVTYSNEAKMEMINVSPATLDQFGAVSSQTAEEMAVGAVKSSNADAAVSITGIAGPDGGSDEKPVGTVWFGIADKSGNTVSILKTFGGTRSDIRAWSENQALELLRRWILSLPLESSSKK